MDLDHLQKSVSSIDLRSCLISRHGATVFEYYRDQRAKDEPAKINSCTKSIVSALFCIGMDRGLIPEVPTPAAEFFPQLAASDDRRKQQITLEHLLTMTAGFQWTEFGGQKSFPRMTRSPHWVDFVLEQPLSDIPGTRFEYNSGVSQMLSAILCKATGMTTARFAELNLFGPLGIENYEWEADPQGVHTGGYGLRMIPGDLLKFGQLYLQQGRWGDKQLISAELVQRSVQHYITAEPPRSGGYGWHWWVDAFTSPVNADGQAPNLSIDYFYARGFGGQFIYVVPQLETVIVLTEDKRKKDRHKTDVFREWIVPLLLHW
ncbi:serine hydrolase domain-containing protein [Paenibacillus dakarensis]|uniref:serine hydrolase domain-containing protein n=1 Tax=Paenibacillus dakarensis TaxID=1527293 RepID=UPI0006D58DD8|nr:serine hydrolase [Paenibacillus dakarensis]